jgi:hypothetical protein
MTHTYGQRVGDATQHVRPDFHVVVRGQQCCVSLQLHIQPRNRSLRWCTGHPTHVESTRRVQDPRFWVQCLCQSV